METALNIVQDSEIIFGETVCVFGLGVVGLLICEILKLNGVKKIIAIDPSSFKREKSKNFGCQSLYFENNEKLISEIYKLTENRGVDIAINVSGSSLALQNAINILAFSGTLIEGSWYGNKNVCLNLGTNFHRKRLKIKSSQVSTINPDLTGRWDKKRRFNLVFELLREIKPSKYITHTFKLIDGQKCFDFIKYNKDLIIQVALQP
ncbi:MAG: hypothetical protein A2Y34_17770 [Spirochaetes bacterium GWC1_27_15]|nr:MAG: hypothetical protein A2Y34_17770 [Spirochaetes bacterium GWC1_27_15]